MNINFKQPKYVLPLAILPFLCLFFYVWHSSAGKKETVRVQTDSLNPNVGSVSGIVRRKQLTDKLDAYRNTYKEAGGMTAVGAIPRENTSNPEFNNDYTADQRRRIDSVQRAMRRSIPGNISSEMQQIPVTNEGSVAAAVNAVNRRRSTSPSKVEQQPDPMEVFRQQMAIMDSVTKQSDPAWREEQRKKQLAEQMASTKNNQPKLLVTKPAEQTDFNTIRPVSSDPFINAVIDENITGYAGSRIRLRLLDKIMAGNQEVPKDSYLFAQITGFSEQRVTLSVRSILVGGKILPVKLDIYDLDGMPGLYVPGSAFREFTKDIGGSAIQGVTLDGGSGANQFMMSSLDKLFQSTSSAIAGIIRKNKAKLKYNSYLYLIDTEALQNAQKKY